MVILGRGEWPRDCWRDIFNYAASLLLIVSYSFWYEKKHHMIFFSKECDFFKMTSNHTNIIRNFVNKSDLENFFYQSSIKSNLPSLIECIVFKEIILVWTLQGVTKVSLRCLRKMSPLKIDFFFRNLMAVEYFENTYFQRILVLFSETPIQIILLHSELRNDLK